MPIKLSFVGTHPDGRKISIDVNNAALLGNPDEPYYTNTIPTADSVSIAPNTLTGRAGQWLMAEFQLKAEDGLLYNHLMSKGWYVNA